MLWWFCGLSLVLMISVLGEMCGLKLWMMWVIFCLMIFLFIDESVVLVNVGML